MKGAIFYSKRNGSTAEYAHLIGKATGLPVLNIKDRNADPAKYDFLVIGSPIIYFKLHNRNWMKRYWAQLKQKPVVFYTVSGASSGPKLDRCFASNLPDQMTSRMRHVALRGQKIAQELNWFDWMMLKITSDTKIDPRAAGVDQKGLTPRDAKAIGPIVKFVSKFRTIQTLCEHPQRIAV